MCRVWHQIWDSQLWFQKESATIISTLKNVQKYMFNFIQSKIIVQEDEPHK